MSKLKHAFIFNTVTVKDLDLHVNAKLLKGCMFCRLLTVSVLSDDKSHLTGRPERKGVTSNNEIQHCKSIAFPLPFSQVN